MRGLTLRELPPTATPIRAGDLWRGLAAMIDPDAGLERLRATVEGFTGCRRPTFFVSSGRAALAVALLAARRTSDRTRVVVPAYTCPTVAQSVLAAGLEPVFCDVSPTTLELERDALGRLLDARPLAVIATHLYGLAHRLDDWGGAARAADVLVVEDAAQSLGARIHGAMAGTRGDAGFYSFGRGKSLPVGHGGVVVAGEKLAAAVAETTRERLPSRPPRGGAAVLRLMAYGVATRPAGWWLVARSPLNPAAEGMDVATLPRLRVDAFASAAAGIGQSLFARLEGQQAIQRRHADQLRARLARFEWARPPEVPRDAQPVFLRFPVVIEGRDRAERLFERLRPLGVSRSYYRTVPDLYAGRVAASPDDFPGARRLAEALLTLPTHAYLDDTDLDRIEDAFAAVARGA